MLLLSLSLASLYGGKDGFVRNTWSLGVGHYIAQKQEGGTVLQTQVY
jgi:hypothetical protein